MLRKVDSFVMRATEKYFDEHGFADSELVAFLIVGVRGLNFILDR